MFTTFSQWIVSIGVVAFCVCVIKLRNGISYLEANGKLWSILINLLISCRLCLKGRYTLVSLSFAANAVTVEW